MDETARAIARTLEDAKAAKAPEPGLPDAGGSKPRMSPVEKVTGRRKAGGPPPAPSTKRPKTGGV